jgi:hypothetical protein
MMQKSTTFTTIFHLKKSYFHYDFACKKDERLAAGINPPIETWDGWII